MNNHRWDALVAEITACRKCPRLVTWREQVAVEKRRAYRDWDYWGKPVPGFGDRAGRILVVGLAPAAHGANRTGRNFTGDSSGDFIYRALHTAGFANQPTSRHIGDGLALADMYIAAACRCAPPDNKPTPAELANCLPYLIAEMQMMENLEGIVVLGKIAFDTVVRVLRTLTGTAPALAFAHNAWVAGKGGAPWLLCSYHPSRQNTQTGRLTAAMFDQVWSLARQLLDHKPQSGLVGEIPPVAGAG